MTLNFLVCKRPYPCRPTVPRSMQLILVKCAWIDVHICLSVLEMYKSEAVWMSLLSLSLCQIAFLPKSMPSDLWLLHSAASASEVAPVPCLQLHHGPLGMEALGRGGFRGAVLRKRPVGEACAHLCEMHRALARVMFRVDGACKVQEVKFKGLVWSTVAVFPGCSEVRWRWEKVGGRWKVWVESDTGETVVLSTTFETSSPQLNLYSWTPNHLEVSLLPLQPVRSPQPSQAELRVQKLMAEVQHERAQKANLQQQCNSLQQQLTTIAQEKAQAVQEKEQLEEQLEQFRSAFALLTQEKDEETHRVEGLRQEKLDLQQQLEQSRRDFALLAQQQLKQSMQEKAQQTEALDQEKRELQREIDELMRLITHVKGSFDAVLAALPAIGASLLLPCQLPTPRHVRACTQAQAQAQAHMHARAQHLFAPVGRRSRHLCQAHVHA